MTPSSIVPCLLWRPQLLSRLSGLPVATVPPCSTFCPLHAYHRQRELGSERPVAEERLDGGLGSSRTELRSRAPKQHRDKGLAVPFVTVFQEHQPATRSENGRHHRAFHTSGI